MPFAFTEQGVSMLSSVLRSKRAVAVNIAIMRAFVRLRRILATHTDLARRIEALRSAWVASVKPENQPDNFVGHGWSCATTASITDCYAASGESSDLPSMYAGLGSPNRSSTVGPTSMMLASPPVGSLRLQNSTPGTRAGCTQ